MWRVFRGMAVGVACLLSVGPVAAFAGQPSDAPAMRWLDGLIHQSGSWATAVSCPTTSFCMVVAGKSAFLWQSGSWTVYDNVESLGWGQLQSVSCPSTTFCVAVDATGYAITFDGRSWSKPVSIDPGTILMDSVSCAGTRLCVAVDEDGTAVVYRSGVWGKPQMLDRPNRVTGGFGKVSCATATFCMATDLAGYVREFDGTTWLALQKVVRWFGPSSISCPTPQFCLAADVGINAAEYVLWDGHSWSTAAQFPGTPLTGPVVSCPSPAFCMVVDYYNNSLRLVDGRWLSGPTGGPTSPQSMSCRTRRFCMAIGIGAIYALYGPIPPGLPA